MFFGSAIVGTKVAFTSPRVIGGIDPGSSFVPPSSTVKLGHFSTVMLTTYSGFHGSLWGWYQHAKMIVTSDGTMIGAGAQACRSRRSPSGQPKLTLVPTFRGSAEALPTGSRIPPGNLRTSKPAGAAAGEELRGETP